MVKDFCSMLELYPDKSPEDVSEVKTCKLCFSTKGLIENNAFVLQIIDSDGEGQILQVDIKEEEAKLISYFFKCHIS